MDNNLEQTLELAKRVVDEAESFSVLHKRTEALFEANRLKIIQTKESQGEALRIVKKGHLGFSATNKANSGRELVEMALENVPFGANARFEFPQEETYLDVEVYDASVEMVSEEEMVRVGQSLIDKMVNYSPELVCEANVVKEVVFVKIRNSKGGEASYRKSIFGIGLEGLLVRGTDMLFVGESESSCHPLLDTTNIAETVIEQLERAKEIVSPPVGHLPVIFTPNGVASALISSLALAFNGKTVLQGASPLGNRKGEKVFDEKFSFWDDATLNFRPGSRICDAEGIPSQKTSLVENGTVMNFLYDLQTAGLANTRSTGNASRSLTSQPTPQISSLVIKEGKTSFSEMVQDIKEGLVVEYVMGATQGNVLGGEFSGNVLLGYKIENGKIVGRVKNTMVSGNVYEILKEIVAIGSESKWVGSLKTPPIYCPRLAVVAEG